MDPGVFSVAAILVGIFLATAVFIWQTNTQSGRLETKIDDLGKELRAEMQAQGKELRDEIEELRTEIEDQGKELSARIEDQGRELRAEIKEQGRRVSDAELEQARLSGVNSVLLAHTHTHEPHTHESAAD